MAMAEPSRARRSAAGLELGANRVALLQCRREKLCAMRPRCRRCSAAVVGDGGRGGAAVDEEQAALAQRGHERFHQRRVGGGAGAFVIVHSHYVRNGVEHPGERRAHLLGVHAHAQFGLLRRPTPADSALPSADAEAPGRRGEKPPRRAPRKREDSGKTETVSGKGKRESPNRPRSDRCQDRR